MTYDVIIIGGGPGGYYAAERAGRQGLKVVCIEERLLGGTCLNEGCIPTKTFLYAAKTYLHAKESSVYGVTAEQVILDHQKVLERKDQVVKMLVSGVEATLQANSVEVVNSRGVIEGKKGDTFVVKTTEGFYSGKNLIIATGSKSVIPSIPGLQKGIDSGFVLTSKEMLDLSALPEKITVLGGGVIGLEMATYLAIAGVDVTVVEMLDHIGGQTDRELVKMLQKQLQKQGIKFELNAKVTKIEEDEIQFERNGEIRILKTDQVLLCIGRKPAVEGFGLELLDINLENGAILTDKHMRTNRRCVYAIGDVNGKSMLAHTAYREAEVAVNTILGKEDVMSYSAIPSVVYTLPELSCVGETEETAKTKGIECSVVKLPMVYSGRFLVENAGEKGIMKLVFSKNDHVLIGAQFLSNYSSEFISVCTGYIENKNSADDIRKVVLPHPTVVEIIRDAVNQMSE